MRKSLAQYNCGVYDKYMGKTKTITIGEKLFQRRIALGSIKHPFSLKQTAIEIDVHESTLSRIEGGVTPNKETMEKIRRWLGEIE